MSRQPRQRRESKFILDAEEVAGIRASVDPLLIDCGVTPAELVILRLDPNGNSEFIGSEFWSNEEQPDACVPLFVSHRELRAVAHDLATDIQRSHVQLQAERDRVEDLLTKNGQLAIDNATLRQQLIDNADGARKLEQAETAAARAWDERAKAVAVADKLRVDLAQAQIDAGRLQGTREAADILRRELETLRATHQRALEQMDLAQAENEALASRIADITQKASK